MTVSGRAAVPIALERVTVRYGDQVVIEDLSLDVAAGEILALLGPSGCGKTTILKAVGGLHPISNGRIRFGADDVSDTPPHRRGVGMVFQSYALFPHLTAVENVAFGLAMRGLQRADRARRAVEALALLQIGEVADRYPAQLSGGQQQRVALARTLVVEPKVLLLDEPLSALDRQLRDAMRGELRRLLLGIGITSILVTHDQDEAMTLSDRIAVMRAGRIEQLGAPREVYGTPRTRFVAGFIGQTNTLAGTVTTVEGGSARVRLDGANEIAARALRPVAPGETVEIAVRPEAFSFSSADGATPLAAEEIGESFGGGTTERRYRLAGGQIFKLVTTEASAPARVYLPPGRAVILAD